MKYLLFLLTMLVAQASMAEGVRTARISSIGMSEYEDYAFIEVDESMGGLPGCSTDDYSNKLIFDINTESGSILYATALLAANLNKEVVVYYDDLYCPLGTEDARLTRLYLKVCKYC